MAKLIIEIDTGKLKKLPTHGNVRDRALDELINLVSEAKVRLKTMGAFADGVVLYGENGPRGRITLMNSDQRQGEPRNWFDDTISAGVPISDRRGDCQEIECICHDNRHVPIDPFCSHCGCSR